MEPDLEILPDIPEEESFEPEEEPPVKKELRLANDSACVARELLVFVVEVWGTSMLLLTL